MLDKGSNKEEMNHLVMCPSSSSLGQVKIMRKRNQNWSELTIVDIAGILRKPI